MELLMGCPVTALYFTVSAVSQSELLTFQKHVQGDLSKSWMPFFHNCFPSYSPLVNVTIEFNVTLEKTNKNFPSCSLAREMPFQSSLKSCNLLPSKQCGGIWHWMLYWWCRNSRLCFQEIAVKDLCWNNTESNGTVDVGNRTFTESLFIFFPVAIHWKSLEKNGNVTDLSQDRCADYVHNTLMISHFLSIWLYTRIFFCCNLPPSHLIQFYELSCRSP